MGRNKFAEPLSKAERKRIKNGLAEMTWKRSDPEETRRFSEDPIQKSTLRTRLDTRIRAKTSNNSNWLHAVGFVVLAAVVISWALGY